MHRHRYSSMSGVARNNTPCNTSRSCETVDPTEGKPSLAMVYSISQSWRYINDGIEGFDRGTIFDELNKPFLGDKCKCGGSCK